jgi:non-specific serine/threonine protein kinase
VPVKQRQALVDAFQRRDTYMPFMVLSLKAGGVGLNLTEANHVVHFDRWWNPAVENQATDRAFRIGQKKNVVVHKFITQGTIEEKIDAMLEDKARLAGAVITAGGEGWITELDNNHLLELFSLGFS